MGYWYSPVPFMGRHFHGSFAHWIYPPRLDYREIAGRRTDAVFREVLARWQRLQRAAAQCCVIEGSHSGIQTAMIVGPDVVAVEGTLLEQDLRIYDIPVVHTLDELI